MLPAKAVVTNTIRLQYIIIIIIIGRFVSAQEHKCMTMYVWEEGLRKTTSTTLRLRYYRKVREATSSLQHATYIALRGIKEMTYQLVVVVSFRSRIVLVTRA